jgi:hypothetical protein
MSESAKSVGQAAFEAWFRQTGIKPQESSWQNLEPHQRFCWEAAGQAAVVQSRALQDARLKTDVWATAKKDLEIDQQRLHDEG